MEVTGRVEPRIVTPPLRPLGPDTSAGWAFESWCARIGRPLLPWQAEVAHRLLELREDGQLRFRAALLVVGRQNGKSEFAALLALWFLYERNVDLVVGTAQTREVAMEAWLRAGDIIDAADGLLDPEPRTYYANGKERLQWEDGSRYVIRAANRRARGLAAQVVLADELREHTDWVAWQAMTSMTLAQPEALIFALSSGGDPSSVVLNTLLDKARADAADESYAGDTFLAEYSAPDGADIADPQMWAYGMPALGHTITVAAVEALRATLPARAFRIEVMGMRVSERREPAVDSGAWAACADPDGRLDSGKARIGACVDVSPDGFTTLAVAAQGRDGLVRVEVAAAWSSVPDARRELPELLEKIRPRKVGWFGGSPTVALQGDLKTAVGDRLVKLDAAEAAQTFASLVQGQRLTHGAQTVLDLHVSNATRMPKGQGWIFARQQENAPISGLYAASGAVLLARTLPSIRQVPLVAV